MPESNEPITLSLDVVYNKTNPVDLLAEHSGLSRTLIKRAMNTGAVWRTKGKKTQRLRRASGLLNAGDNLSLYFDPEVIELVPPAPTLIAEEESYSVWFKPAGLMASGTRFGDHCTINRWIETNHKPERSCYLVHRLDRFATGLMVIAHSKTAATHLSTQFEQRKVRKIYRAVVHGLLDQPSTQTGEIDGKAAITHIAPIATDESLQQSIVNVEIETGRKHQIRAHLAEMGHPILGDRQYGSDKICDLKLTAWQLDFIDPMTDEARSYRLAEDRLPGFDT